MKKALLCFTTLIALHAKAQKLLSEGTVTYSVEIQDGAESIPDSATYYLKFKGANIRSELTGIVGKSVYIFDTREGIGAVLREFGGQRILIPLNRFNWDTITAKFSHAKYLSLPGDTTMLNFSCQKVQCNLADGSLLNIWFTADVLPEIKELNFPLANLNGLPVVIEMRKGEQWVVYKLIDLNYDPVQIQYFDIPRNGYRLLDFNKSLLERY